MQVRADIPQSKEEVPKYRPELLAKNVLWNFLGMVLPLIVAILTMPTLILKLGVDRFGILTLAWVILGYFSLFDMGIGRAMTKLVAEMVGEGRKSDIPNLFWTAQIVVVVLSTCGAVILSVLAPWLTIHVIHVPQTLEQQTINAFYLIAGSLPFVVSTTGLRGLLEAFQKFGWISVLRIMLGLSTYIAPFLIVFFTRDLIYIMAVLVAVRAMIWGGHFVLCLRTMPSIWLERSFSSKMVHPLLGFGGWMTISNIVGPMMVYFDRFVVAAVVSTAAVAYYTTPYELVTKLWVIPVAISGVLFPLFSHANSTYRGDCMRYFDKGIKYVALLMFPITLILISLANEGLGWWINPDFANHGAVVVKWLAVGVFVNALAQIAFALIQGLGRPDITAKFHLIELPVYLGALWWLTHGYGIKGTAMAWSLRTGIDAVLLLAVSDRLLDAKGRILRRWSSLIGISSVMFASAAILPESIIFKGVFLLCSALAFLLLVWFHILEERERFFLQKAQNTIRIFLVRGKS